MISLGLDQHVAENGHRGFRADDVENLGESVTKVVAVDVEFHGVERELKKGVRLVEVNKA